MTPATRVLSHPTGVPYVDLLDPVGVPALTDLPDDVSDRIGDPGWLVDNTHRWEIAHVHIGRGHSDADQIGQIVRAHRRAGTPVVCTVHDLERPRDGRGEDARAALLAVARECSALLTFTRTAATQIMDLVGMRAVVVPHGPVLSPRRCRQLSLSRRLQPWTTPSPMLVLGGLGEHLALDEVTQVLRRTTVPTTVLVKPDCGSALQAMLDSNPRVEVMLTPTLPPDDVASLLQRASHLVLPYRYGTHSRMIELAADSGVPVVPTTVGALVEQRATAVGAASAALPEPIPVHDGRLDVDALDRAMHRLPVQPIDDHSHRAELRRHRESAMLKILERVWLMGHARSSERVELPPRPAQPAAAGSGSTISAPAAASR